MKHTVRPGLVVWHGWGSSCTVVHFGEISICRRHDVYHTFSTSAFASTVDSLILPFVHSILNVHDLSWASSPTVSMNQFMYVGRRRAYRFRRCGRPRPTRGRTRLYCVISPPRIPRWATDVRNSPTAHLNVWHRHGIRTLAVPARVQPSTHSENSSTLAPRFLCRWCQCSLQAAPTIPCSW